MLKTLLFAIVFICLVLFVAPKYPKKLTESSICTTNTHTCICIGRLTAVIAGLSDPPQHSCFGLQICVPTITSTSCPNASPQVELKLN